MSLDSCLRASVAVTVVIARAFLCTYVVAYAWSPGASSCRAVTRVFTLSPADG